MYMYPWGVAILRSVYLGHDGTMTSNAMYPRGMAILWSVYFGHDGKRTSHVMFPWGMAILRSVFLGHNGTRTSNVCSYYDLQQNCIFKSKSYYNIIDMMLSLSLVDRDVMLGWSPPSLRRRLRNPMPCPRGMTETSATTARECGLSLSMVVRDVHNNKLGLLCWHRN